MSTSSPLLIEKKIPPAPWKILSATEIQKKIMQEQLDLKDVDGMTVLMLAARSRDVAMVGVILTLIKSSEVSGRRRVC